jgi:hypothetical protein
MTVRGPRDGSLSRAAGIASALSDPVGFLVETGTRPTKSVLINVMLPQDLVTAIDRVTTNRSRFLAEAAKAKLQQSA